MANIRSPNYPAIGLKDAIERVGKVFERERQHPTAREVVMKGMGFGGVNGASLSAISAARKYGLLEKKGQDYRVTDRAVAILHPHNPEEKLEAIRAATTAPSLFAELVSHYSGDIPSDDALRAYLARRGFGQSALTTVIQAFRETIELAGPLPKEYKRGIPPNPDDGDEEEEEPMEEELGTQTQRRPAGQKPASTQTTAKPPFKVTFDGDRLEVVASLKDVEEVDKLIAALNAYKALL